MSSLSARYPSAWYAKDKPIDAASEELRKLIAVNGHLGVKKFLYHGNNKDKGARSTKDSAHIAGFLDEIGALQSLVQMELINVSCTFPPMRFCNALSNSNHTLKSLILKVPKFSFGNEDNRSVIQAALPNGMPSLETFKCEGGNGSDMLTWAAWCTTAAPNLHSVMVSCSSQLGQAIEDASLLYLRDCPNLKRLVISPSSAPAHQHTIAILKAVGRNKGLYDFSLLCALQPYLTQAVAELLRAVNNVTRYHFQLQKQIIFHDGRADGHIKRFPTALFYGLQDNHTLTSLTLEGKPGCFDCDAQALVGALAKSGSIHAIAGFVPKGNTAAVKKQLMVNKEAGHPRSENELVDRVAAASRHPEAEVSLESTMRLLHSPIARQLFQGTVQLPPLAPSERGNKRQRVNEQGEN